MSGQTRETELHRNPFNVLGASTRDSRTRILELAEERSLLLDEAVCQRARSELTAPRTRLGAELGWLPGVSPGKACAAIEKLEDPNWDAVGLPPLARANVLASRLPADGVDGIVKAIKDLAEVADEIDVDEVLRDINEDRALAEIPKVTDRDAVDQEILSRRRAYLDYAKGLLDGLPTPRLVEVVNEVAEFATSGGADHGGALVEDIVGVYEVACQGFIEGEAKNVETLLSRILVHTADGNGSIKDTVRDLRAVLNNYSNVIRPIQLISRSKGIDHPSSRELAYSIRGAALELNNTHNLSEVSNDLTKMLQAKFDLLTEFAEHVSQDAEALKGILESRREAQANKEKWEQSLSYATEIGVVFSEKLHMSADGGVSWRGQTIPFEDISWIRWGGTRHSVNGIPTGTTYDIHLGSEAGRSMNIHTRKQEVFTEVVDRLWRGAGVRIAIDYARHVKGGGVLRFPNLVIEDRGLIITRKRMFKADEDIRLTWDKVRIWDSSGNFCIGDRNDTSLYVALSYLGHPNTVVLENMLRTFWKSSSPNLGSLAE